MVAMPVLSPRGELERPEPPYISAGIDAFRKPRLKVQKAVHERLLFGGCGAPQRPAIVPKPMPFLPEFATPGHDRANPFAGATS